jgi:hypothetical protein
MASSFSFFFFIVGGNTITTISLIAPSSVST